ncbi:MAG TPA: LPS export ABC transporter permease LptF [Thermoanaerobaculia bacterium]|nr:LPS export ABC transporter permease LptF [Thermoanaerobaculia bacterium]
MKRLERYIFREILGPLALGLMVFTFLLLIDVLFDLAEVIIRRNVPGLVVGKLLLLNLPHIVVLTIPMSLLFGILIAIGRLASDSELVAMRASGVSLFRLYRPVLVLSALLTAINVVLMVFLLPWGNRAEQELEMAIFTQSVSKEVKPGVFYEELEDRVLYVFAQPPEDERWNGVFLAEAIPGREHEVTVAQFGAIEIEPRSDRAILRLQDSTHLQVDLDQPERGTTRQHETLSVALKDQLLADRQARQISKTERILSVPELIDWATDPERPAENRRRARVELHKKLSIPAACLVFGLFAVPLGFNNHRGGRSSGFAVSILVILVYYIIQSNGENAASQGQMAPWLAMWLPNFLFTGSGLFLLARRNRDKSLLLTRLDHWVRSGFWSRLRIRRRLRRLRRYRRRQRRSGRARIPALRRRLGRAREPDVVLRIERPRMRFPNALDRYVLRVFAQVLVVVMLASTTIYIVANFTELVDDVMRNDVAASVVVDYYKYLSLQIVDQILPVVVLLTTLITFGLLSRSSEVIAMKAVGVSLYRLALPVLLAGGLIAAFDAMLGSSVLPHSNSRVAELKDEIRGVERVRTYRRADQQWMYGRGGFIYNYQYFDPRRQTLQNLQVFHVDPQTHELLGLLFAERARYRDGQWLATDAWTRAFDQGRPSVFREVPGTQIVDLPEEPSFFDTEVKRPEQMTYAEHRAYLERLQEGGQEAPDVAVELHNKVAMPVMCFIMALVALPFAFRLGPRGGALYGIGIALVLGMSFYAVIAMFSTLGEAGALPPAVAVWSPNVLFGLLSLYLFLGIRT